MVQLFHHQGRLAQSGFPHKMSCMTSSDLTNLTLSRVQDATFVSVLPRSRCCCRQRRAETRASTSPFVEVSQKDTIIQQNTAFVKSLPIAAIIFLGTRNITLACKWELKSCLRTNVVGTPSQLLHRDRTTAGFSREQITRSVSESISDPYATSSSNSDLQSSMTERLY